MAELFSSVAELITVLKRPKRLVLPCLWTEPQAAGQRKLRLRTALQTQNTAIRGVALEISCSAEGFDLSCSVILMAEILGKLRAIARIDMNGPSHPNTHAYCGSWQHTDAGKTHFHDTSLHSHIPFTDLFDDKRIDLPVAQPINDMPINFSKAMEKCGELMHIENLADIEEPKWQPQQFLL